MQYEITTLTAEVLESSLGKHVSVKIPADEVLTMKADLT